MRTRPLGATGLNISVVGFGCGGTSGLMGRGSLKERVAVANQALEAGINYFDTAPGYDGTRSESGLGETLKEIGAHPLIGTKIRLEPDDLQDIRSAVQSSVEGSLRRLQIDTIDLIQVHNRPALEQRSWDHDTIGVNQLLGQGGLIEAMEELRAQGKVRYLGFTAIGEVPAFDALINSGRLDAVQTYYNLLNPSAGMHVPVGFRGADYGCIIQRAADHGIGVLAIRSLAAGALTSLEHPHALAGGWSQRAWYEVEADRLKARALASKLEVSEDRLTQFALQFALSHEGVSSVLVGFSDCDQVAEACAASELAQLDVEDLEGFRSFFHAD